MNRLSKYLSVAMATIIVACANETTKVSQEGVCAVDTSNIAITSADTIRSEKERTATTTTNITTARELQRPQIKQPVSPTDSASVSLMGFSFVV